MRSFASLLAVILVAAAPLSAQQAPLRYDSLAFGRQLTGWLLAGAADSLWARTAMSTQLEWAGENRWTEIVGQFKARLGQGRVERVDERWAERGGKRQYWFVVNVPGITPEPYVLRWVLDPTGVAALGIMPYAEAGESIQVVAK